MTKFFRIIIAFAFTLLSLGGLINYINAADSSWAILWLVVAFPVILVVGTLILGRNI